MNTIRVEESAVIDAPAARIYAILADYRVGHPLILPARYFTGATVTKGGQGAGTEITVTMNVYGSKATYQMKVSEPEPVRVLQEEDAAAGVLTTFTVDALNDTQARVTIATTTRSSSGLKGWLEKMTTPGIMRRIYRQELAQIVDVVTKQAT